MLVQSRHDALDGLSVSQNSLYEVSSRECNGDRRKAWRILGQAGFHPGHSRRRRRSREPLALPISGRAVRRRDFPPRLPDTSGHFRSGHGHHRAGHRKAHGQVQLRRPHGPVRQVPDNRVAGHAGPDDHRPVLLRHRRMGHQVLRRLRRRRGVRPRRDGILRRVHRHGPRGPLRQPRPLVPDLCVPDHHRRRVRCGEGHREDEQDPDARAVRAAHRHLRLHDDHRRHLRGSEVLPCPGLRQAVVLDGRGSGEPAVLLAVHRHGHNHSRTTSRSRRTPSPSPTPPWRSCPV